MGRLAHVTLTDEPDEDDADGMHDVSSTGHARKGSSKQGQYTDIDAIELAESSSTPHGASPLSSLRAVASSRRAGGTPLKLRFDWSTRELQPRVHAHRQPHGHGHGQPHDGRTAWLRRATCRFAWIAVAATELLGCLTAIGGAIGVSPAALSVSVLAWGNSVGDLASDVVLARGGQPTMAVAACFSGPLFNMMVGLGCAFAMATAGLPVNQKSLPLARHPTIAMGFAFLFVSLVATATLVPRRGYVVTKTHGVGLIALYAVYMVCAVLVEIAYDGTGG